MSSNAYPRKARSACPHDCPSTCALEIELEAPDRLGRVRGAKDNSYTGGVVCAKVARYAERVYHPDRLLYPLKRVGPKGSGQWERIGWDDALDVVASAFLEAERAHGAQSIWPYFFAGTMGLVQRDGLERLRHAKGYSGQYSTICVNGAWPGYMAGTGRLAGPDPREMAKADCVVIWGTNPVATQVNVMTHAIKARKERGARIVVVDVYRTATMEQADMGLIVKPGTDGALACAVMHTLFRDGHADRDYMARFADCPDRLEAHLATRGPDWAAPITGLSIEEIEAFAKLVGTTKRSFFRLGYGFTRQRNGVVNMHAATSIATVLGAWQHEGGGAFHNNGAIYKADKRMLEGLDRHDPSIRKLDQSKLGRILTGDKEALKGGGPIKAMLIQNTNPACVTPEQGLVRTGFAREDLFVCVHEHFMTDTARIADIVLPASMFTEHEDVYKGGGHQYWMYGPKLMEPPGECRSNHWLICALAERLGAKHPGFEMDEGAHIRALLDGVGQTSYETLKREGWVDVQPGFDEAHYRDGFAWPDGKYRFSPDWMAVPFSHDGQWDRFHPCLSCPTIGM